MLSDDIIGMKTIYDVEMLLGENISDKTMLAHAECFKSNFLDKVKLGVKSGEGFWKYPGPAYSVADFLKQFLV